MIVRTKICGVTTEDAVLAAVECGANAVGFVFATSPRQVTVERARMLAADLPPFVARVAVFRYPQLEEVERVCSAFDPDVVQAEPTPDLVTLLRGRVRLLPVLHDHPDLVDEVEQRHRGSRRGILLEAPGRGGRGKAPDRERARQVARRVPLILAGGLNPDNVVEAVREIRPYGVDVSSGVERERGVKDPDLIARFLEATRTAQLSREAVR